MNEITNCQKQFKDKKVNRSLWNIKDHVPSERKPKKACYDNKKLSNFTHDDFAGYVFDHCDSKYKLQCSEDSFLLEIDMLNYIPENYARPYLYGVWDCIKPVLNFNKKTNK